MSLSKSEQGPSSRVGLAPGMIVDGKYHLKRLLGAGGGGEVWEAEEAVDAEAWRSIALKLLKTPDPGAHNASSPSPGSELSLLHEARAVSQVSCEALPKIHTVGMASIRGIPTPFIAMELLEGQTLDERLAGGRLHWRKALAVAQKVAAALDACHEAGVIHCDLKPRNVFLDRKGRVLVLDFGVASLGGVLAAPVRAGGGARSADETDVEEPDEPSGPEAPAPPPIMGTPGYISPERLTGLLPDHRDDAFALGVVLHWMIAGRLPHRLPRGAETSSSGHASGRGPREIALHRATVDRMFEPLAEARPATPMAVLALVATLLGPAPDRPAKGQLAKLVDEVYRRPHGRPATPYAGLEAFGERRMGYLPGRSGDIESIVRRLQDQVGVVLCGPSGAGKSSLAMAGIAARIDEEMLLGTEGWNHVVVRPSGGRSGLHIPASQTPNTPPMGPALGTLVIVDQLEEVLSLPEGDRRAFCQAFAALVTRSKFVDVRGERIDPRDVVRVVATVRDDLFGRVAALPDLERLPERNLYVVRGVDPNAAREIVLDPLKEAGYTLEQAKDVDVVGDVARELGRDASALPLVQFALARLWDKRDPSEHVLRAQTWKEIGGIVGALGEAAQKWYEGLYRSEKEVARRLFLSLFEVDGTRNLADEATLGSGAIALVFQLVEAGILRRRAEEGGRVVIEPLHEALAKGWPLLGRWLDEVRADRELARDAQRDAKRWERNGRPVDMLWGGTLLKNTGVLQTIQEEPGRAFIAESLAAADRARRRGFWVGRVLPAAVLALVLGTAFTGWWTTNGALSARNDALGRSQESEKKARASEQEALQQKGVAEARQKEAEAAKKKVAELGKEYEQKFNKLSEATDQAIRERSLQKLEEAKKNLDQNRLESPSPTVAKPSPTVRPPMPDPFE